MIRFVHTSDWQLGMSRAFLTAEAQARYAQDRIDAIRSTGRVADEADASFVVVSGDVFDSNFLDRRTVLRTLEALGDVRVPVYLLPGNHDPLCPGSIYDSPGFSAHLPAHVHVIRDSEPIRAGDGLEIVGVPWVSLRHGRDVTGEVCRALDRSAGRVLVAHGALDVLSPDRVDPSLIDGGALKSAVDRGAVQYVALGDRHSTLQPIDDYPIWYSGTPEATAFREVRPGRVLVVTIEDDEATVTEREIGRWRFEEITASLISEEGVGALSDHLESLGDKERTAIRLDLAGTIPLRQFAALDDLLGRAAEVFAAVDRRTERLAVVPDDTDFSDLAFTGFVADAVDDLRKQLEGGGEPAAAARDALGVLFRLSRRDA
jgi:DNA repair exonuclease SbcCD nuclease subunit